MKLHLPKSLRGTVLAAFGLACTGSTAYAADLEWTGENSSFNNANAWVTAGTTEHATFTDGDNLTLGATPANKTLQTPKNQNYAAGTVTLGADYTIKVDNNTTLSGVFSAANNTITKLWGGTLTLNAGSELKKLEGNTQGSVGVVNINASEVGEISIANQGGTVNINADSTVGSITASSGTFKVNTSSSVGNITIADTAYVDLAEGGTEATHYGTITVKDGNNTLATFTARSGGATYTHVYFNGKTDFRPDTGTAKVENADVTISGTYVMRTADLTGSKITVSSTGTLCNNTGTVSVGELVVEAGGKLEKQTDGDGFAYSDAITLTLSAATFTAPSTFTPGADGYVAGYSTSALAGVMDTNSSLTLNFGTITFADSINKIQFTLDGLTAGTNSLDSADFTVTGWTVDEVAAVGTTGTMLYLSRPSTGGAIPEPTTATLSLLALAGLAARRRRK